MRKKLFRRFSIMVSLLVITGLLVIVPASPVLAAAPVIDNLNGDTVTFTEDAGPILIDDGGNATVDDTADATGYDGGSVIVQIWEGGTGDEFLSIRTGAGVELPDGMIVTGRVSVGGTVIGTITTLGQDGNNLVVTLNGDATDGLISTLLQNLTYNNTSQNPAPLSPRHVYVTVSDSAEGSAAAVVTVNLVGANDAPVIDNLDGDILDYDPYAGGAALLDDGNDATVTDVDSANFNTGNITVSIPAGGTPAEDVLGIENNGTVSVDGVNVLVGATIIGTITSNGVGVNLVVTFNANATPARVTELLRALTYENTNQVDPSLAARTVRVVITDYNPPASRFKALSLNRPLNGGGGVSDPADVTVNMETPEINLKQGATDIADGGTFDFGDRVVDVPAEITFIVENTGAGNLTLTTPLVIGGANADQFSIQQQPVSPVVGGANTTFIVRFRPTSTGPKTATIAIANNDGNEDPYDLTLQGAGISLPPPPPTTTPPGDDYIHVSGGQFNLNTSGNGQVQFNYAYSSEDGVLNFNVDAGTTALDANGNPLTGITINTVTNPPPPPPGVNIVGPVFSLEPSGATFDGPLTMTFHYEDGDIPPGVAEESLSIAFYNETTGEWTVYECTVDTVNNVITAHEVSHFTDFGVIGESPAAPATPASFSVSGLTISPAEVETGGTVTVSVAVANSGGTGGDYAVTLTVDGAVLETTTVTLVAGATGSATFTLTGQPAGTHAINVNGLTGSFTVAETAETTTPPYEEPTATATATPTSSPTVTATPTTTTYATGAIPPEDEGEGMSGWWWLVIVGGIIIIGIIIWLMSRRRD